MASHTPSSNQLPATSQINKSSLPSPTLDAAALRQRWRQKDRHERFFYMRPSYFFLYSDAAPFAWMRECSDAEIQHLTSNNKSMNLHQQAEDSSLSTGLSVASTICSSRLNYPD